MAAPQALARSRRGIVIQLSAIVLALFLVGIMTIQGSKAAFSDTTENAGNRFSTGDVTIEDDDNEKVMFTIENMKPDTPEVRCINVTYTGSLDAEVRMYGTIADAGLAKYLDTQIVVGTGAAGTDTFSCTGFTAGAKKFGAALDTLPASFGVGLDGFDSPATTGSTKSYQITVTLKTPTPADETDAQGKAADAVFTWEAQSS